MAALLSSGGHSVLPQMIEALLLFSEEHQLHRVFLDILALRVTVNIIFLVYAYFAVVWLVILSTELPHRIVAFRILLHASSTRWGLVVVASCGQQSTEQDDILYSHLRMYHEWIKWARITISFIVFTYFSSFSGLILWRGVASSQLVS